MATSPQDGGFNPGPLVCNVLPGTSSSSSLNTLSSDTWQSISHELAHNEQSIALSSALTNTSSIPQRCISATFDVNFGHSGADPVFPGSHRTSTWEVLSPNPTPSTVQASLVDDSPVQGSPWEGPYTQLLAHHAVASSASSYFVPHARNSMETMLSSDQIVVPYDVWHPGTPMTMDDSTLPSMPEALSGLTFEGHENLDQGLFGTPEQSTNTWTCDVNGCTKQFNQQHRYNKHVKSHTRPNQCSYPGCPFTSYQEKDVKRHINTVHRKKKIPCPVVECPYSRNGPRRGISRKDALRRHLLNHGMTPEEIAAVQNMETPTGYRHQDASTSAEQDPPEDLESFLDF